MKKTKFYVIYVFLFMMTHNAVLAFDNSGFSADSSFGYDVYDILFNKVLGGPIGWVAVAVLVIVGFYNLGKGQFQPAILSMAAGAMIKATPTLLKTLGANVQNITMHPDLTSATHHIGALLW